MVSVSAIIKEFRVMYEEDWKYVNGGSSYGSVDCQGAFKYVYKKYGESNGWRGSNDMARNWIVGSLIPLSRATLSPGMAVFRVASTNANLDSRYKPGGSAYNGDVRDYHHIGLVDEDTKYMLHASGTRENFARSKVNSSEETYVAYLKGIDYGNISISSMSSGSNVFTHYPLRDPTAVETSQFGNRNGSPHKGIDLGVPGNPDGTVVVQAVRAGKVIRADRSATYGNVVYLEHDSTFKTVYAHLHSLSVGVGEEVNAGHQLGYMGTTGDSSAPHLHFEVLVNGEQVNPKPYLPVVNASSTSPSGTGEYYSGGSYSGTGEEDYTFDYNDIPYNPVAIVGRRTSQIASQPLHAYVKIYLGDKLLANEENKPNTIQRLSVTRVDASSLNADVTLFDPNWDEIEDALSKNYQNVVIEYGYRNQKPEPVRRMFMLQTYSLDFTSVGTILNVNAITDGAIENLKPVTVSTGNAYNPTEAVKKICEYMGWKIGSMDATVDVSMENPFNVVNDFPITYIQNEIVPLSQTPDGESLEFELDDTVTPHVASFKRITYESLDSRSVKTFIYQRGYDSVVQALSFNVKGVFGGGGELMTASGLQSGIIDTKTKEIEYHMENNKTAIVSSTGNMQHISSTQSIPYTQYAGSSPDQMKKKLYYSMQAAYSNHYEATMTILGDTSINVMEPVRLINLTDKGTLHHTSGIYTVKKILDNISDGSFLTTLEMYRSGTINSGVELISPKVIVK